MQATGEMTETASSHVSGVECMTDTAGNDIHMLEMESNNLQEQLKKVSYEDTFKDDDDKVRFYTKLPNFQ